MAARFPKAARLLNAKSFEAVRLHSLKSGQKKNIGPVTIRYSHCLKKQEARLGLAIGKRAGNSVSRNRLKRVFRDEFRMNRFFLPAVDFVLSISRPIEDVELKQIRERFKRFLSSFSQNSR